MSISIETNNSLTMKGSGKVTIKRDLVMVGTGTKLPVEVTADFSNIPVELHELYYQSFVYNYNDINVWNNTKKNSGECCNQKSNIDKIVDLIMNALPLRSIGSIFNHEAHKINKL